MHAYQLHGYSEESSMKNQVFKVQEKKGFCIVWGLGALLPGKI